MNAMPKMAAAFAGWNSRLVLAVVKQSVVAGLVKETITTRQFSGTVQPLSPKELMLKEEGQRSFTWLQIHVVNGGLTLTTADRIIYDGMSYKIMKVLDYRQNNYTEYHAIQDYAAPAPAPTPPPMNLSGWSKGFSNGFGAGGVTNKSGFSNGFSNGFGGTAAVNGFSSGFNGGFA